MDRKGYIGGSDANIILSGDAARIARLVAEKRGEVEPEDLSQSLPVQLGIWTEQFNRLWYKLRTGNQVTGVDEVWTHRDHYFIKARLDGFVEAHDAVFEAKHVNPFGDIEGVVQRYMPQLHHYMMVTGRRTAILSVLVGTQRWECFTVDYDPFYADLLLDAELQFWVNVQNGGDVTPVTAEAPKPRNAKLKIDMTGHNEWAALADTWLSTNKAARDNTAAKDGLKKLIEDDVAEAFGHGVSIKRGAKGALTIREARS
jgi:predicted phage-related endonuclease